jgi:hypothetical protein
MADPLVQVDGARQLRATMKAAGADLRDLTAVNKRTAAKVSQVAAGRTPRRTGALAATVRPAGTRTAAVVRAGRATVPYAKVIEYGWPGHNIGPQPYVTSAAHDTEPEWTSYYEEQIETLLHRIRGD